MESLNMNILANSLPNSNLVHAEADLTNNFKGQFYFFRPTSCPVANYFILLFSCRTKSNDTVQVF